MSMNWSTKQYYHALREYCDMLKIMVMRGLL